VAGETGTALVLNETIGALLRSPAATAPPAEVGEMAQRVRDRAVHWPRRHGYLERAAEDRSNAPPAPHEGLDTGETSRVSYRRMAEQQRRPEGAPPAVPPGVPLARLPGQGSGRLPPIQTLVAGFQAEEDQLLPPLPTTAVHGALGKALKSLVCTYPERTACAGCPRAGACAYPELLEPPATLCEAPGVTTHAPAALVIAPMDAMDPEGMPGATRLVAGDELRVRVTLVGERARAHRALVETALEQVAEWGLGVYPRGDRVAFRPRLRLARIEAVYPRHRPPPSDRQVVVSLRTPLRLKARGKLQGSVDGRLFWREVVHRADLLARAHGGGAIDRAELPVAPFETRASTLRVVEVRRYSTRQGCAMVWPGLLGEIEIAGDALAEAWPLLMFGVRVQIGKGTSFGFGAYALEY
jgi:hypothetical protein